jgi:NADPH:quinone reductase-like Zn-dependent oxidoreductase
LWPFTGKAVGSPVFTGLFKPSSPVPGTDFSGQIEAIGSEVSRLKVGDRVWGFNDTGLKSQAQYMVLKDSEAIFDIPEGFSYEQAASSAEGAHYANNFINKIDIKKGEKVLVNGATGAIGSAAVQMLKHLEAQVTAVSHSDSYDLVKSLGAEKVINFDQQDFTRDKGRYHYVFDAVGKSTFAKCRPLLLPGGIYISSELGPNAQNLFLALSTPITGNKFGWKEGKRVKFPIPFDIKASLSLVKRQMEQGKFKPLIDRTYPMESIREAYTYVLSGQKKGNVVITYHDDGSG